MKKIEIKDLKISCPMLGEITERGKINFGTCGLCKFNILGQMVDNYVYCNYGASTNTGGGGNGDNITDPEELWDEYENENNQENNG